jgi:PIN domain nuclease of toxin-antitoxin system
VTVPLLLDTNALLWTMTDLARLGRKARREIAKGIRKRETLVSAVSFWEVALLSGKRRLRLGAEPGEWRRRALSTGIREVPLTGLEAIEAACLDGLQPDPADRFIVATARLAQAKLVTADQRILAWGGELARLDAQS